MLYWDTETGLIQKCLLAPQLACITWAEEDDDVDIVHGRDPAAKRIAETILSTQNLAANNAYDLAIFGSYWPDMLPLVFESLEGSLSHDLILNEKLCDIGDGQYRTHEVESLDGMPSFVSVRYNLSDIHERYTGAPLEKDQFRLTYGQHRHKPLAAWPEGAIQYPKNDTAALRTVHRLQQQKPRRVPFEQYIVNEPAQSRAQFAFHLVACWGFATDGAEVRRFMRQIEAEQEIRREYLIGAGLVRPTGQRKKKEALALMREVMGARCTLTKKGTDLYRAWWGQMQSAKMAITLEERAHVKRKLIEAGYISLAGDVCIASGNNDLKAYALYGQHQNLYSKVRALDCDAPIQTSFEPLLETGRVSSFASKIIPNSAAILNLPRKPGMRECFVPRNWQLEIPLEHRRVLLAADYGMAELVSLAQVCYTMFGYSALRDVLNAGRDPHLELASDLAKVTYDEALALYNAGDERIDQLRTLGKSLGFGFMGGLGPESFVSFASKVYGVTLAEKFEDAVAIAKDYKYRIYYGRYPEIKAYHQRIGEMCEMGGGVTSIRQFLSNRLRGYVKYTVAANGFVQALTADAFKAALWEVQKRCYLGERLSFGHYRPTALTGARVVAPVHDEMVLDILELMGHDGALELQKVMVDEYQKYTPDVRIGVEFAMMRRWRKKAKPVYNEAGRLIPFEPAMKLAA